MVSIVTAWLLSQVLEDEPPSAPSESERGNPAVVVHDGAFPSSQPRSSPRQTQPTPAFAQLSELAHLLKLALPAIWTCFNMKALRPLMAACFFLSIARFGASLLVHKRFSSCCCCCCCRCVSGCRLLQMLLLLW